MVIKDINTIDELLELFKNNKFFLLTYFDNDGHEKFASLKTGVLKKIFQIVNAIDQSQFKVEVDQEKIEELISSSMQPLAGSIPSIENTLESAEKKISQIS